MATERDRLKLYAVLVFVSVALQGCEIAGCTIGPASKTTTTTTTPMTTTTTASAGATTTTTTSTSATNTTNSSSHCKSFDESHACTECDDAFDLKDGACFFNCETDMKTLPVRNASAKGLCMDDTTFQYCADEIPHIWPNTEEPVKSVRLFSSWQGFWPEEGRTKAWKGFVDVVKKNGMKVLVGTQITCNETDDDRDWEQVKELVQLLGPEHILGLAVGNELELLYTKTYASSDCIQHMWKGGYFWAKTVQRVKDFDALGDGYSKIPVTSVFGAAILGGEPFYETDKAMCASYMRNATQEFASRWIFSINVYPYLDPSINVDEPGSHKCDKAIAQCTCLDDPKCLAISVLTTMRRKMKAVTGNDDDLLYIGETGWSSPQASTLSSKVAACPDFSSKATFEKNYRNFLDWDLNISSSGVRGPDHVFYFTMRDSVNFGHGESFGLVGQCGDTTCKLQKTNGTEPNSSDVRDFVSITV